MISKAFRESAPPPTSPIEANMAGMTGWAQVNGLRGRTSLKKRLQYDLYYINNWSLGFDLYILARTPFVGFRNKNAH